MRAHLYIIPKSANDPKSTSGQPPFIWLNDSKMLKIFQLYYKIQSGQKQMQASNMKCVTGNSFSIHPKTIHPKIILLAVTVPGWFVDWTGHKNNSSKYPEDSGEEDIG